MEIIKTNWAIVSQIVYTWTNTQIQTEFEMVKITNITGEVVGDTLTIPVQVKGLTSGQTIVKLYATFKKDETDIDGDAIVQKMITSGFVHTGTTSVVCDVNVTLSNADTTLFEPYKAYTYDIQVHRNDGEIRTVAKGTITFIGGVTAAFV